MHIPDVSVGEQFMHVLAHETVADNGDIIHATIS